MCTIIDFWICIELLNPTSRGLKRSRSPDTSYHDVPSGAPGDDDSKQQRKRGRPMKAARLPGNITHASPTQNPLPLPPVQMSQPILPPHTPQSQNTSLPPQQQVGNYTPAPAPAPTPTQASPPPKTTPTKTTLKALPTVRDHTTDQLGPGGDEYIPRETDEAGEKKVMLNGQLLGGREYRCRTFLVPNRGDKLFMLATECARVLGYRDSYLLFNKNRSLFKIIANQTEKDDLVAQEILPFSYRSRQIAIVTARSMFRQFGSRVIVNGRRVRDDYWEGKARKQGFTEADLAGEKRPGASKARDAAEAANNAAPPFAAGPQGEIVYTNTPQYPGGPQPPLVQPGMLGLPPGTSTRMPMITAGPDLTDTRPRDYSTTFMKGGPRQEITGQAYQDRTQPTPMSEINQHAHQAAEFNRTINQQRDMRTDYMQNLWRRPHEQPATSQPIGNEPALPTSSRPGQSPHATTVSMPPSNIIPNQSPQMMMTAAPYSQPIHSQQPIGQGPMRGMPQPSSQKQTRPSSIQPGTTGSMPQSAPTYNYGSSNQMWGPPQTPQTPQHYSSYTTQAQHSPHPQQSPAPQLRHQGSNPQMQQGTMQYPGMQTLGQSYQTPGQSMYPPEQTPRQFMPQNPGTGPAVTQAWSTPQTSSGGNWWASSGQ